MKAAVYAVRVFVSFLIVNVFLLCPLPSFAQDNSFGVATSVVINEGKVNDGDIVSFSSKKHILSNHPYDGLMVGVVSASPAASIVVEGLNETYQVISRGNTYVRVSTINGPIKNGDLITSSSTPGVGMKADQGGYVLGIALSDYSSNNQNQIRKIPVSLNIHYDYSASNNPISSLVDILNFGRLASYEQPSMFLKYFIAGVILLISIIFGFLSFGRSANAGIEALGRNPMASKSIQFGIILNTLITIVIIIAALAIAYIIITS